MMTIKKINLLLVLAAWSPSNTHRHYSQFDQLIYPHDRNAELNEEECESGLHSQNVRKFPRQGFSQPKTT